MMIMTRRAETRSCRREQRSASREPRESPGAVLMTDANGRAGRDGLEEVFRHELRHANASMGSGITRKISRVQPDAAHDPHEIRHRRAFEMRPRRFRIFS